jgi:hypothetical protein
MRAVQQFQEFRFTRTGYDAHSTPKAESAITHAESAAVYESIAKHTITKTHVEEAGLPKIPITVSYRLRTKHARSCLRQEYGARYFLFRWYHVPAKQQPWTLSPRLTSGWMVCLQAWTRHKNKPAPNATNTSRIYG